MAAGGISGEGAPVSTRGRRVTPTKGISVGRVDKLGCDDKVGSWLMEGVLDGSIVGGLIRLGGRVTAMKGMIVGPTDGSEEGI